ncbi:DNA-binding CsgD family transcriptional regulator/PAS domain-containing protein [Rhizobium sp. BK312]|uniref:helix-turn-helix transcriptional regulator n=1 Tax=Rhizobium sp. BK312 TaxID=2587080 RepID=UPI001609FB18|nr:helix-turn-helix transcriptional regulator [Rhizobium sp. BK312]MBB3428910.1 DNA-binding CsgD family transcriptional regulator/PAS domain-containing protein [Rhizobium sp. BK312]
MTTGLDPATLSALIARIYDSALDPDSWPETLNAIAEFRESRVMALVVFDTVERTMRANLAAGLTTYGVREMEKYSPLMPAPLWDTSKMQLDQPISVNEVMNISEFHQSRFCCEWALPNGFVDASATCVMKTPSRFAMATCLLPRVATPRDRLLGALLAPHIRRAVTISDLLDSRRIRMNRLQSALDALNIGVVIAAEGGNVLHANAEAEAMASRRKPIQFSNGRIQVRSPAATSMLHGAIGRALREETSLGASGIGVPTGEDGGAVLHVLPLERRDRGRLRGPAAAAVFIASSESRALIPQQALADAFSLTAAEAKVMLCLAEGKTLAEIAQAGGIAINTVRTHLVRLLAKTGSRRQADLVRLVHRLGMPFGGCD